MEIVNDNYTKKDIIREAGGSGKGAWADFAKFISFLYSRSADDSDPAGVMTEVLGELGRSCGASRAFLSFYAGQESVQNNFEWCAGGVATALEEIKSFMQDRDFFWWKERLQNNQVLAINNVTILPDEAGALREALLLHNIRALIAVPVYLDGKQAGLAGLDMADGAREWTDTELVLLRLTALVAGQILKGWQTGIKLSASRERSRKLVEILPEAVIIHDWQKIIFINPAAKKLLGLSGSELLGGSLCKYVHPSYTEKLKKYLIQVMDGEVVDPPESLKFTRGDNSILEVEVQAAPLNEAGRKEVLLLLRDLSERRQAEELIQYYTYHDILTGLPNRVMLRELLNLALIQAFTNKQKLAVMFLDLDRFKIVNDAFGHSIGDQLIKNAANRLKKCLRASDTVARLGGDEFMILLPGIKRVEDTSRIAQKIITAFQEPWVLAGYEFNITPSMGIAVYPNDGEDADTLMKNADATMYRAKEKGKNNYQYYTRSINEKVLKLVTLEKSLRQALDRGEFTVHYQPQIEINSGAMIGVEALVRLEASKSKLVGPAEFIPLAEDTGLIVPIGNLVLRQACAQNKAWQDAGYLHLRITVNLSARQFHQEDLVEKIKDILGETGLEPRWLELEITETVAMRDVEFTIKILQELTAMGIRFSIDDFGIGYSSFKYIKDFPISTIKIDRSFINDITTSLKDEAITAAIIALSNSLRIRAIAEGVETVEQARLLQQLGCTHAQGYLFCRPVAARELEKLLRKNEKFAI